MKVAFITFKRLGSICPFSLSSSSITKLSYVIAKSLSDIVKLTSMLELMKLITDSPLKRLALPINLHLSAPNFNFEIVL